jgi:hypothetical protein
MKALTPAFNDEEGKFVKLSRKQHPLSAYFSIQGQLGQLVKTHTTRRKLILHALGGGKY